MIHHDTDGSRLSAMSSHPNLRGLADYAPLSARLAPAAAAPVELVAPTVNGRVLDVGAGDGTVATFAARRSTSVIAVDPSPAMVTAGRTRTGHDAPNVRWHEANLEKTPLPDESFDVVLSSFGLIFAPRPSEAIRELHRVPPPVAGSASRLGPPPGSWVG